MTSSNFHLTGLIAASFTAFHDDGSLNLEPIEAHAGLLARNGVSGVFVCGSTGEGVSMTTEERMHCLQRWRDVARGGLKVLAHVGHNSLGDAQALAAHAQKAGVDAIATVAPSVLRPATVEDLVDWCAAVAARAPDTPYYYYHIPVLTHVRHDMARFMALAAERIPTFAGLKFTDENLMEFGNCVAFGGGRYNLLYGRDEILLAGLATGAHGAIGSTYNYSAPVYSRVIAAFGRGDMPTAMREMTRARDCVQILEDFGGAPAGKAMLKLCGVDCGPMRLPLRTLSPERVSQLQAALEAFGWDDVRCK
ncbi:MAG: dihydrodipicolinate synthase family protein [Betaproteobacteria bacterium]|nr:dihydrodipicolinate synthase family protein [Betaproteobacteria bacterium]